MGDDEAYNFDVSEDVLLTGGGGAHEEEEGDFAEAVSHDLQTRGDSGSEVGSDDDGESDDDGAEGKDNERSNKKRAKLQELKKKKRLKVEQGAAAAAASQRQQPAAKGEKPSQLTPEEQYLLFMRHQPTSATGGLIAAVPQSSFVTTTRDDSQKGKNAFVSSIDQVLGGGSKSKLAKPSDEMGCPQVLIICAGAKRAAQVINGISKKVHCKIFKCFAKHIKVTEHVEMLAKTHYPIAVGTPNRVEKLLELGALCLRNTQLVLVDMAEDAKEFTVLSLPGVQEDFYKLVGQWVCKELTRGCKVMLLSEK